MPSQLPLPPSPAFGMSDLYYTLFRHKWKILVCALLGFAASFTYYRLRTPPLQSEAKLFVRYVETERKTSAGPSSPIDTMAKSPDVRGETIMNSEIEILTSIDLIRDVVDAVGAERILAQISGGADAGQAISLVKGNLQVEVLPRSSVFRIVFSHPDPAVAPLVLREIIDRYLRRHLEIHRAAGMIRDSLAQETDQLRSRLAQTEEQLRQAKIKAGIASFEDTRRQLSEQIAAIRQQIFAAEAELAAQGSVLEGASKRSQVKSATPATEPTSVELPPGKIEEYASLSARMARLLAFEQELSTLYTSENARVKEVRAQIADADNAKRILEQEFPSLIQPGVAVAPSGQSSASFDYGALSAQHAALRAKIKTLTSQYEQLRAEAATIDQSEAAISELVRKKDLEEANYRYYAASLEQSRINETLANGRVSNISEIQSPSPPSRDWSRSLRILAGLAGGGLGLGLAWAFLIEFYLDRSLRRPKEIERLLGIPLFISVPRLRKLARLRPNSANGTHPLLSAPTDDNARAQVNGSRPTSIKPNGAIDKMALLAPFHDTLRDRLIAFFEARNLTHKPKLVALTGLGGHAGVSTTAAGLARSLSETGEGNVLLVDMTAGQASGRQFVKGKAICGLDELLDTRQNAHVEENLYVVVENHSDQLSRNLPQRFTRLVPKLKASDFDYIIFDMPAVSQISITPRLASFMDMVLMVVESEKTSRDTAQHAAELLGQSKAHVGVVLNKTRNYVPSLLNEELLAS